MSIMMSKGIDTNPGEKYVRKAQNATFPMLHTVQTAGACPTIGQPTAISAPVFDEGPGDILAMRSAKISTNNPKRQHCSPALWFPLSHNPRGRGWHAALQWMRHAPRKVTDSVRWRQQAVNAPALRVLSRECCSLWSLRIDHALSSLRSVGLFSE